MEKYKQPSTHNAFQESTVYELLVEYYEDLYDKNPKAAMEAGRSEDGELYFDEEVLGDPILAKWESEYKAGLVPDLTEGMSDKAKADLLKDQEKVRNIKEKSKLLDAALRDDYKVRDRALKSVDPNLKNSLLGS